MSLPFGKHLRLTAVWATLLAWALRLSWLGRKALWIDEADSLYFAVQPLRTVLLGLCDPHPPGYYLLLKGVVQLGRSEFWLRLPSVIAATLAVPLLFRVGWWVALQLGAKRSLRVATLSAWLLAVAPLHVWYAQEARMYALVTTLGLLAMLFALRLARRPTFAQAGAYVLVAALALWVDQSAALSLVVTNLLWFWIWACRPATADRGRRLGLWLGLQILAGVPFLLWWSNAQYLAISDSGRFYQLTMLMRLLQRLGLTVTLEYVQRLFLAVRVGGALVSGGLYWAALRRRRALGRGWAFGLAILFALGTVVSVVPRLFTVKRLLLGVLPYAMFASAWALTRLRVRQWPRAGFLLLCVILSGVNLLVISKAPWREVTAWVEARAASEDVIWVDALAVPAFDYYYEGAQEIRVLRAAELGKLEASWEAQQTSSHGRLWMVVLVDPYRNLLDYVSPAIEPAKVEEAGWSRVVVQAYQPASLDSATSILAGEPPAWLLAWPSPLDPACQMEYDDGF